MRAWQQLVTVTIVFAVMALTCRSAGAADVALQATTKANAVASSNAIEFLLNKGRAADGSFSKQTSPAITALVLSGILRHGRSPDDPRIAGSLKYLQSFAHDDGGIYKEGSLHQNYETCLAIVCFSAANADHRYDALLKKAEAFVKDLQWNDKEGADEANLSYGGAGYGNHKRPDLSNTNFLLDALQAAGDGPDDEAVKKALIFVSRCQNLESEHNTSPFAAKNPDGGFYYTPAAGGNSQAGPTADGGLRSYGSMTYAGLKSMVFAGVDKNDPRVKAAVKWLADHYDLTSNPGMEDAGLYYYYHTMAKALNALGQDTFEDSKGVKHNWRAELTAELVKRQKPDGSWVNDNARWLEGDANLATGYALMALYYARTENSAGESSSRGGAAADGK